MKKPGNERFVDEDDKRLPHDHQGDKMGTNAPLRRADFTRRPSLYRKRHCKRMEGLYRAPSDLRQRLSTTIQDREYVPKEGNRLFPRHKARLVTASSRINFRK